MMYQDQDQNWGWASFGKRDGFELLAMEGALQSFSSPRQLELLGQALQLRLEGLRIFPESRILGITRISIGNDHWQFFSLYQYILDIYKRDGFYGASVGLKSAYAKPRAIMYFLENLAAQTHQRIQHQEVTGMLPSLEVQTMDTGLVENESINQCFIPFSTNSKEEEVAFIEGGLEGKLPGYRRILGAYGWEVFDNVDEYVYARFDNNPFFKAPSNGIFQQAYPVQREMPKRPEPIVKTSVLDAFEVAGEDQWKKNGNGKKHVSAAPKGFFDKVIHFLGMR